MKETYASMFLLLAILYPIAATGEVEKATIVGQLLDGTPPVAPPELEFPEAKIRETRVHQLADRKITINRIKAPTSSNARPLLPENRAFSEDEVDAFRSSSEVQCWLGEATKTTHMFISASVVDNRATLIRWWHDGTEYRAWSNANWLYLTGFTTCQKGDRRFSTLLLAWNTPSTQLLPDSPFRIPKDLPPVPGTYRLIQGDPAIAEALEGVNVLHELYQSEFTRLKEAYELREMRQREREAEFRANPPEPEDIVISCWKVHPKKLHIERRRGGER